MHSAFNCYALFEEAEGNFERGIVESMADSTSEGYATRLRVFTVSCQVRGIPDFPLNSEMERDAFETVSGEYVLEETKAGSTMDSLRCALRKVHMKHRISPTWTNREDVLEYVRGLKHRRGQDQILRGVQARVILQFDHLVGLCRVAIIHNKRYLARGYYIMFMGLLRHSHVRRIMRADILFSRDPTNVKIWAWGYKTGSHTLEGSYHKIVGFREEMELWINEKQWKWTDLMLEDWSEAEALAFLKQYCASIGIVGFKVDIHCFRGSGVDYYENEVCLDQKVIRVLGRWSASSHRYESSYRATLPPEEMAVLASTSGKDPTMTFDKCINYQRSFSDAEIAGLAARRAQVTCSHGDVDIEAEVRVPNIIKGVDELFPGAVNALAQLGAYFPSSGAEIPGDALLEFQYQVIPYSAVLALLAPLRRSRRTVWIAVTLVAAREFYNPESSTISSPHPPEIWVGRLQGDRGQDDIPALARFTHQAGKDNELELCRDEDQDHVVKTFEIPSLPIYYVNITECSDPYAVQRSLNDTGSSAKVVAPPVEVRKVKPIRPTPSIASLIEATIRGSAAKSATKVNLPIKEGNPKRKRNEVAPVSVVKSIDELIKENLTRKF